MASKKVGNTINMAVVAGNLMVQNLNFRRASE